MHFVSEWIEHYFATDSTLWRTLRALALRPGFLSLEYFSGRRQRYVRPLRLYLAVSLLFFIVLRIYPSAGQIDVQVIGAEGSGPVSIDEVLGNDWGPLDTWRAALTERIAQKQDERAAALGAGQLTLRLFVQSVYYAMFLLLPAYALLLKLLYLRTGRTYGEHLVVALNSHSAVFLLLITLLLIPFGPVRVALLVWMLVYPTLELRRIYGGRHWQAIWKSYAVSALYIAVSLPVFGALLIYALLA